MDLFHLIFVLVVIGVLMWAVNSYVPMEANIKKLLNIAVVVCAVLWLLQVFGFFGSIGAGNIRVGPHG